jgi:hypothetical protein
MLRFRAGYNRDRPASSSISMIDESDRAPNKIARGTPNFGWEVELSMKNPSLHLQRADMEMSQVRIFT